MSRQFARVEIHSLQRGGPRLELGSPFLSALGRRADHLHVLRLAIHEVRAPHHRLRAQGTHDRVVGLRPAHNVERRLWLAVRGSKRGGETIIEYPAMAGAPAQFEQLTALWRFRV